MNVAGTLERARLAAEAVDAGVLLRLARDLVRTRSVFEPGSGGNETAAAEVLAEHLRAEGLDPVLEEAAPGRPNLICDWAGSTFDETRHRTLMLEGHTDVVTEGNPDAWRHPPFEAVVEGDVLHGRGSADMKGGVAAAVAALLAVRRTAPDLAGRLRLGVVADEEGMMLGIKHFIARGWAADVTGAIICEPEENELCLFQKGAMRVRVEFQGVMAHGAMPYAGVNPIAGLGRFLEAVRALERSEQERVGDHPYLGRPWLTPTIVKAPPTGEAQLNVMPERAHLSLDIRTGPGQDHEQLLQELRQAAAAIERDTSGLDIELDCFESRPWTETPADDPLVRALEQVYPLVFATSPRYGGVPGATDGTFLRALAGVPIVTVGPGDRTIPHQRDEFVRISEMEAAARLYAAAAIVYLDSDPVD